MARQPPLRVASHQLAACLAWPAAAAARSAEGQGAREGRDRWTVTDRAAGGCRCRWVSSSRRSRGSLLLPRPIRSVHLCRGPGRVAALGAPTGHSSPEHPHGSPPVAGSVRRRATPALDASWAHAHAHAPCARNPSSPDDARARRWRAAAPEAKGLIGWLLLPAYSQASRMRRLRDWLAGATPE